MEDATTQAEENADGTLAGELRVGDLVLRTLVSLGQRTRQAGSAPHRFVRKTDPVIYRVTEKVGGQPFAYRLCDNAEPSRKIIEFVQPVSRRYLVKLDMPELEHHGTVEQRRIEVFNDDLQEWKKGTVEKFALYDGRTVVRWDEHPGAPEVLDLTTMRYRYLHGEVIREWDAEENDDEA